jgi:hypothetical protein
MVYMIGTVTTDAAKHRPISDLFFQFERQRGGGTSVDKRLELARTFRSTVFSQLSESERADLQNGLFAAQIRRYGILAMASSSEKPPRELATIFQTESLRKMREIAPSVAKEIRISVNKLASSFLQSISRDKFDLLVDLDYPIPMEIVLTNFNKH